jgi:hypothetical protein
MNESPEYTLQAQKIETTCRNIIDKIFVQAQISLEDKQDIITLEWLKCEEIKELQNHMSDALILYFDNNSKNIIPERLELYLQTKIRQEAEKLFENNKVTADGMKQFFYISKIMCGLSRGSGCHDMIRTIKKENDIPLLKLKIQEKIYRYEKKEDMRQLCKNIIGGLLPRQ